MGLGWGEQILSMITLFQPLTFYSSPKSKCVGKQNIYSAIHPFPGGNRAWLTNFIRWGQKITFRKIKTFHINKDKVIAKALGRCFC